MLRSQWPIIDNKLSKTYQFKDFKEAFDFMTAVAKIAEQQHHHPDWSNSYNTVTINLSTHDEDDAITAKDHRLAIAIDEIE